MGLSFLFPKWWKASLRKHRTLMMPFCSFPNAPIEQVSGGLTASPSNLHRHITVASPLGRGHCLLGKKT